MGNRGSLAALLLYTVLSVCGCRGVDDADATTDDRLRSIDKRIIADPSNSDLFAQRARLFESLDSAVAAMNDWKRAIALDSTNASYHEALADLFYRKVRLENAEHHLLRAVALDPGSTGAKLKLAELWLAQRRYQPAMDMANTALRQDPQLAQGYFIKGWIHMETGDTSTAISSYRTAVERDPLFYRAHVQLGVLLAAMRDPLAMDHFGSALRVRPDGWEALYGKAMYAQENGMDSIALQCYVRIQEVDPRNPLGWYNAGYILLEHQGAYSEAHAAFTAAIERHPLYTEAYYSRALAYEHLGELELALEDARKAHSLDPAMEDAEALLVRLRSRLGRP